MLAFKGSHGTTLNRARSIEANRFLPAPGRLGEGAYFWTAVEDEHIPLADDFARRWAQRRHGGSLKAIVNVEVEVDDDRVLYLDDPEHHLGLRLLLADAVMEHFDVDSPFKVSRDQVVTIHPQLFGVIEEYIQLIEAELGYGLGLVFKCQTPPVDDPLKELIGLSTCFSVRDIDCIKDLQVRVI